MSTLYQCDSCHKVIKEPCDIVFFSKFHFNKIMQSNLNDDIALCYSCLKPIFKQIEKIIKL